MFRAAVGLLRKLIVNLGMFIIILILLIQTTEVLQLKI